MNTLTLKNLHKFRSFELLINLFLICQYVILLVFLVIIKLIV